MIGDLADPQAVGEMTNALRHRGPDDGGIWSEPGVALGHRRLAILDLSAAGHQPMRLGPLTIVFNGEIYNYRDLRADLPGPFISNSDTEVLLHLFRELGDRCVGKLRGMFAFAIWDRERRRLFAARDHVGLKPFHYRHTPGAFAFASELGALQHSFPGNIDRSALADYLTYGYVPTPKSVYAGIRKLPAGHSLTLEDDRLRIERYWSPAVETRRRTLDEATHELDALLREVVPSQLISDVPVGVFLSGGLDSATTAYYAGNVRTFTLGIDDPSKSELEAARSVAERFGVGHQSITTSAGDVRAALDTVTRCFGEPFGDDAAWSNFIVSKLARAHVTVALSGDGGDELFAGYGRYRKDESGGFRGPRSWSRRLLRRFRGANVPRQAGGCGIPEAGRLMHPSLVPSDYDPLWHYRRHWRGDLPPAVRQRWLDLQTSLPDRMLTKVDRTSMAHALEVRPPLLDHRIVEFAFTLPPELLVDTSGQKGKLVLRRLMGDRLPPRHMDRPKRGFGVPVERWLSESPEIVAAASRSLMAHGVLRRPIPPRQAKKWNLVVLARWLDLFA